MHSCRQDGDSFRQETCLCQSGKEIEVDCCVGSGNDCRANNDCRADNDRRANHNYCADDNYDSCTNHNYDNNDYDNHNHDHNGGSRSNSADCHFGS